MKPTVSYLQNRFQKFNRMLFQNKLPMLPISLGNARGSLGGLHYMKRQNLKGQIVFSDFRMTVSTRFDLPETVVENTLIHEMIHYYIVYHQIQDTSAHGEVFQKIMNAINAKTGRNITISHQMTSEVAAQDTLFKMHYICVSELTDGVVGITLAAKTRVFDIWKQLPQYYPIRKMSWYGSTDPYFNRFPRSLTPKMYSVNMDELRPYLEKAVELENTGYEIRPKRK